MNRLRFYQYLLCIVLLAPALGKPIQQCVPCEPSNEIRTVIRNAIQIPDEGLSAEDIIRIRKDNLTNLLKKYPNNFFVCREFVLFMLRSGSSEPETSSLANRFGDAAVGKYFLGMSLMNSNPDRGSDLLEEALKLEPSFAWPHLELAGYYYSGVSGDSERAKEHLLEFLDACPDTIEGYRLVSREFTDKEVLAEYAVRLRDLLNNRPPYESVSYYPDLWAMEFTITPLSRYDEIRSRVRKDVGKLKDFEFSSPSVFIEAYRILGDEEGLSRVQAKIDEQKRQLWGESFIFGEEQKMWFEENPPPLPEASIQERQVFSRKLFDVSGRWVQEFPSLYITWRIRLNEIGNMIRYGLGSDVNKAELVRVAEKLMAMEKPDGGLFDTLLIANLYLQKDVDFESTRAVLDKVLNELEEEPVSTRDGDDDRRIWVRSVTVPMMYAELHLKMAEYEETEETLDMVEEFLELHSNDYPPEMNMFDRWIVPLEELRAELAFNRGDRQKALTHFQKALSGYENLPEAVPFQKKKTELTSRIEEIIKEQEGMHGAGEEDGIRTGSAKLAYPGKGQSEPVKAEKRMSNDAAKKIVMPPFELVDLNGKTWNEADFEGKITLVNVWFTSCGPCVFELPLIQSLYEKLAQEDSLQLVTFNIDRNPAIAQDFMKNNGYTFPVILAKELVSKIELSRGYPQNWFVSNGFIELYPGRVGPVVNQFVEKMREMLPVK